MRPFSSKRRRDANPTAARRLDAGDRFPTMSWRTVDGESVTVPDDYAGRWAVVLLYRGHW